ncbi:MULTISPECIES: helix-turn-helix domain-containing protein [Flavobacteriaceae]|uniref:Helicase n=2 Tax=Flavobacteriaceae TaxID=49546 RepID=A0A4Y8AY63_9FLAO|nr:MULTISPECIES: helix-turn-helix domain-containing protein [Flavobacteriaceae]TEW76985.1 helicase [Gramella jeungdoensis]GGK58835.1 helicase [Lutibacter litoralis]
MKTNNELELVWNFVNNTDRNVFLTGKAGTGKTTFLHKLKNESLKRMVVVAPTGVAAINAKGMTIHSFFQMPFGPILPETEQNKSSSFNRKFSKTKINIIKSMDLLVIDEISMVRADLLDGIDKTLRRFKNSNKVFGGVQLLMIGDLQQLSPVIKESEWQLLKPFYKNGFFFSSHSYQQCNPIAVELKHVYRQDNQKFIEILNEIRNNTLSKVSADELNKRFLPDFVPNENEGYISLTTHNNKAEKTNILALNKLKTKAQTYTAKIERKFPEFSYPNKEELVLKVGAQVLFIKNDSAPEKRYFNGKIGKVIFLDKDEVIVKCPNDAANIVVKPEIWENINYTVDPETKEISETSVGSFTQMPLRLAWAITIHKSQGLTFEKAIIDAQAAFAHGQTYVALSRCKSLEGLVLKSSIDSTQIISDSNVISFNKNAAENQPDEQVLQESKSEFQLNLIVELFDFFNFLKPVSRVLDLFYKNRTSIEGNLETTFTSIKETITNLLKIANSFKIQLEKLAEPKNVPETNKNIQGRFIKALKYFNEQTSNNINEPFKTFSYITDNKAVQKDIDKQLDIIEELLAIKLSYFKGLSEGFNTLKFLELRANAVFLTKETLKKTKTTGFFGTANKELFERLRELRDSIAKDNNMAHFQVFTQRSLYEMCETLPTNKEELLKVKGFGKKRVKKYGDAILKVLGDYWIENDIEVSIEREIFKETKPKQQKGASKEVSLELFKSGKTVFEIAKERGLTEATITAHLTSFIASKEIKVTDLISEIHYKELKKIIPTMNFENLSDLKHQIDEKYTYTDLRLVLIDLENSRS